MSKEISLSQGKVTLNETIRIARVCNKCGHDEFWFKKAGMVCKKCNALNPDILPFERKEKAYAVYSMKKRIKP